VRNVKIFHTLHTKLYQFPIGSFGNTPSKNTKIALKVKDLAKMSPKSKLFYSDHYHTIYAVTSIYNQ